jgi:hypothetical protein
MFRSYLGALHPPFPVLRFLEIVILISSSKIRILYPTPIWASFAFNSAVWIGVGL